MYSALADIQKKISSEDLLALTNDGTGQIDTAKVTEAIQSADGLIDSYVGTKYSVPLATIPDVINDASAKIAIYILFVNAGRGVPEERQKDRDDMVSWLRNISEGKASLGIVPQPAANPDVKPIFKSQERVFDRDKLKNF